MENHNYVEYCIQKNIVQKCYQQAKKNIANLLQLKFVFYFALSQK